MANRIKLSCYGVARACCGTPGRPSNVLVPWSHGLKMQIIIPFLLVFFFLRGN